MIVVNLSFSRIFFSVSNYVHAFVQVSMYEYEDSCNLFKCWGFFFYNLKAVLINIFIVNLSPSSKFIDDDAVILRIHFQKN